MTTSNAPALSTYLDLIAPTPLTSAHITSPQGRGGGREWADGACKPCGAEITRAAFSRHRLSSCPSRRQIRQYQCRGCSQSYSRLDALKRHWKEGNCPGRGLGYDLTLSIPSSSSGHNGDPHTDFPVMPQIPQALRLLESPPSPITPAPVATSTAPYTTPNPYAFMVTHQKSYLRSASQASVENHPPPQYGHPPTALTSHFGDEQLWPSGSFAPRVFPDRNQFPYNTRLAHEFPLAFTNNHMQYGAHNYPAHQPMVYSMYSLPKSQFDHSQSQADEQEVIGEASPSAISVREFHDPIRGQPAPGPPAHAQPRETFNLLHLPHASQFAFGSLELEPALMRNPSLELGHGSLLEARISANASPPPIPQTCCTPPRETPHLRGTLGPHLNHEISNLSFEFPTPFQEI